MAIISILNPKGGSGKTTLATNLTRALDEAGYSVLLVDSDPQGSARDWHAAREDNPLPLIALDRPNNIKTLGNMAESYDYVVIDGAAKMEDMLAATIKVSDAVLIPVQPSPYDIWAASDLVSFISARREVTDGKPAAAFVITRRIEGTRLGDDVRQALGEFELDVCVGSITQRQVYPQTASEGLTVIDSDNEKAKAEIVDLAQEISTKIAPVKRKQREVRDGTHV